MLKRQVLFLHRYLVRVRVTHKLPVVELDLTGWKIDSVQARSLTQLPFLRVFKNSSNFSLKFEGLMELSKMQNLTHLHLRCSGIYVEEYTKLRRQTGLPFEQMKTMKNLRTLELGHSDKRMARVIANRCPNLKKLVIGGIGNEGVKELSRLKLEELDISFGEIGNKGAQLLAQVSTLQKLDASNNSIGSEGLYALAFATASQEDKVKIAQNPPQEWKRWAQEKSDYDTCEKDEEREFFQKSIHTLPLAQLVNVDISYQRSQYSDEALRFFARYNGLLSLRWSRLCGTGCKGVVEALLENRSLVSLESANPLVQKHIAKNAHYLRSWKKVAALIMFQRALRGHPFRDSALVLIGDPRSLGGFLS